MVEAMSVPVDNQRLSRHYTLVKQQYDKLLETAPKFQWLEFQGVDLGELVKSFPSFPLLRGFVRDVEALKPDATNQSYEKLEERLVAYLKEFKTEFSGKAARENISDRYLSIRDYLNLIQKKFQTNPKNVEKLRLTITKILVAKVRYGLRGIIDDEHLLERAEAQLRSEQPHIDF